MSMIDYVTTATTKYIEQMPKAQRKKYGQFFTSKETAVFMAELFDLQSVSGPVSILDPGAGSGILSTALIERMQRVASITKIELVCYESDTNILELLRSNLDWVCDHATKKIEYKIISDNYILSQVADYNHMLWESPNPPKYWTTNKNLKILFNIDKVEQTDNRNNTRIVDHVLDIRVQNQRSGVSLPLSNRSKGFNWFFSFLVWFMKIQENRDDTYILLLDEPGLNLHAKAQNDLLRFLCDLSGNYQIIYTTHSPFMIETEKLNQVRTVLEKDDGTHISESVQEKDPNTLFPLQAALGYDLAQNLFVAKKNLLVEGIADLTYLTIISNMLNESNRACLKDDVVIVPTGGADKIATFVSLLRGNELSMVCLLDTFTDKSAQARLNNLTAQNIIKDKKIVFYHDILNRKFADVEDMFSVDDYLCLYNGAFGKNICRTDIDDKTPILTQLKKLNGGKDFNHYTPANYLAKNVSSITLSDETMGHFENLFQVLNKLF